MLPIFREGEGEFWSGSPFYANLPKFARPRTIRESKYASEFALLEFCNAVLQQHVQALWESVNKNAYVSEGNIQKCIILDKPAFINSCIRRNGCLRC